MSDPWQALEDELDVIIADFKAFVREDLPRSPARDRAFQKLLRRLVEWDEKYGEAERASE